MPSPRYSRMGPRDAFIRMNAQKTWRFFCMGVAGITPTAVPTYLQKIRLGRGSRLHPFVLRKEGLGTHTA